MGKWVIVALVADIGWIAYWVCIVLCGISLRSVFTLKTLIFVLAMLIAGTGMNVAYAEVIREKRNNIVMLSQQEKSFGLLTRIGAVAIFISIIGTIVLGNIAVSIVSLIGACLLTGGGYVIYSSIEEVEE